MAITVKKQGKVIVERDGDAFMIMFPDGNIVARGNKKAAERVIDNWCKKDLGTKVSAIGIAEIEWRD